MSGGIRRARQWKIFRAKIFAVRAGIRRKPVRLTIVATALHRNRQAYERADLQEFKGNRQHGNGLDRKKLAISEFIRP